MLRKLLISLLTLPALTAFAQELVAPPPAEKPVQVMVIPVREQIGKPVLYVVRRGLKEAIDRGAGVVVIDMKTPGGRADVMLDIMEALDRFPGETITYVNDEAGSAGALIAAVTDEIYFAPNGVMGAAELVSGSGSDVPDALKRKMTSYINAKVRALSSSEPRRADVLKAMTSPDFELKIGDTVLKPAGELLTVTADEAVALHGEPAAPLLAQGIADDVDSLLRAQFGAVGFAVTRLEVTWSEQLAVWLNAISPVLLGLGLLALFVEFKTPGFGLFGIAGMSLLAVVFLGNFAAGLSGHEPMLVFGLGLLLLAIELFFFPGVVVMALSGVLLMLGSLLWSMADIWPNQPVSVSSDLFLQPAINLGLGLALAVVGAIALLRFLPKGVFWNKMVLAAAAGGTPSPTVSVGPLVGREGVAATDMFPSGQVEIDGSRYEACVSVGSVEAGQKVVVRAEREFGLLVDAVEENR
ncbi:MAG: hypothetical protein RIS54_240 [Verrucomicrobiota bacterium]|jgi:membrane-bound serine protease (ClpP class)